MAHTIEKRLITREQILSTLSLDYGKYFSEVNFSTIRVAQEPEIHMSLLERNILEEGIREPIIIVLREQKPLLVEGHHRAAVAVKYNLELPGEVHHCSCASYELDFFGLCAKTLASCSRAKTKTVSTGWAWAEENYLGK